MSSGWPAPLAHGFADAGAYPLPMPALLAGAAALLLAATALPARRPSAVPALADDPAGAAVTAMRALALVMVVLIAVPAALGDLDIARNPAPQLLFTVGWAGLLLTSALLGGWWRAASPLRWAAGDPGRTPAPAGVGVWPAVATLVAFSVAEQLATPTALLVIVVVAVYVVGGVGIGLAKGPAWIGAADPLEVASRTLGAMSPLARADDGGVTWRSPRAATSAAAVVPGLPAFLGALIGVNLFDAYAGHGADAPWVFAVAVVGGAVAVTAAARPAALAVAFIGPAVGHVAAHYLAPLLIDGQVAVLQLSDPFGLDWNLLGLTGRDIVAQPVAPVLGMTLQLLFLVAGHVVGMAVAGDVAASGRTARAARAVAFPTRALLVASLVAGIYLRLG